MADKSKIACEMSVDALAALGEQEGRRLFLWTFTFADVLEVKEASKRWGLLQRDLVRCGWRGLRVYELHDQEPCHGLHVHCLTLGRRGVKFVRALAQSQGFGRIHVQKISRNPKYVAKYINKCRDWVSGKRVGALKGVRLWGKIGVWAHVKACNILIDSLPARVTRAVVGRCLEHVRGFEGSTWSALCQISEAVQYLVYRIRFEYVTESEVMLTAEKCSAEYAWRWFRNPEGVGF